MKIARIEYFPYGLGRQIRMPKLHVKQWVVFHFDNFTDFTTVQVAICHSGSIILTWGQGWQWCHKSSLTKISFTCNSFRKTHLAMIWLSLHFVFIILWHGRLHFSDGPYAKEGMKKGLCSLTEKTTLKNG